MQGGWGVQTVLSGPTAPSCGARVARPISNAFARFDASAAEKIVFLRMVSRSRKSPPSCGNGSCDLTFASHTHSSTEFDRIRGFTRPQNFRITPLFMSVAGPGILPNGERRVRKVAPRLSGSAFFSSAGTRGRHVRVLDSSVEVVGGAGHGVRIPKGTA